MIEATDQIQTPAVPDSPFPEAYARNSNFVPCATDVPCHTLRRMRNPRYRRNRPQLWQIHNDFKTSLYQQSQDLHSLRVELGKKLASMKALLAKPGRNGQWSAWLKQNRISRATADRLVTKYERSLNPDGNCLSEAISEPTEEEIQTLLDTVAPKLRRGLRHAAKASITLLSCWCPRSHWSVG